MDNFVPSNIFLKYIVVRSKSVTQIYYLYFHYLTLRKFKNLKQKCKMYIWGNHQLLFWGGNLFLQNTNCHRYPLPRVLL